MLFELSHRTAPHRAAVDATVTAAVQYLRVGRLLRRYLCILANDMFAAKIKCIKVEDDIAVKLEEQVQSRADHCADSAAARHSQC